MNEWIQDCTTVQHEWMNTRLYNCASISCSTSAGIVLSNLIFLFPEGGPTCNCLIFNPFLCRKMYFHCTYNFLTQNCFWLVPLRESVWRWGGRGGCALLHWFNLGRVYEGGVGAGVRIAAYSKYWTVTGLQHFLPSWTNLWPHYSAVSCRKCPKPVTIRYSLTLRMVTAKHCLSSYNIKLLSRLFRQK